MRKFMLSMGALALLAAGGFGCVHDAYHARANYHHDQAREDAKHGDFGHALHNEHEAAVDQRKADETRY